MNFSYKSASPLRGLKLDIAQSLSVTWFDLNLKFYLDSLLVLNMFYRDNWKWNITICCRHIQVAYHSTWQVWFHTMLLLLHWNNQTSFYVIFVTVLLFNLVRFLCKHHITLIHPVCCNLHQFKLFCSNYISSNVLSKLTIPSLPLTHPSTNRRHQRLRFYCRNWRVTNLHCIVFTVCDLNYLCVGFLMLMLLFLVFSCICLFWCHLITLWIHKAYLYYQT